MRSIGVRELKQRTSQVLRQLRESGKEIEVSPRRARAGPAPHGGGMVDAR